MTRTVKKAEFAHKDDLDPSASTNNNIIDRQCLHGGAVTVASVRFPPPWKAAGNNFDGTLQIEHQYVILKSQGRVVFARGPWIESRPLFPYCDAKNDSGRKESLLEVGNLEDDSHTDIKKTTHSDSPRDKECYKILAFGNDIKHGSSSTIEAVHGMIFPSSFSSLAYLNNNSTPPSNKAGAINSGFSKRRNSPLPFISVVAFGGRRISFLTGGGLWNDNTSDDISLTSQRKDNFASISITKTNNQIAVSCPYLEVSDWIHDVRLLRIDYTGSSEPDQRNTQQNTTTSFLIAMGMVNNSCDIWGFHMTAAKDGEGGFALHPTRLQCITCDVRCMTYSLSFYGWNAEADMDAHNCSMYSDDAGAHNEEATGLPSLVAASGTVFGEIIIWGAVSDQTSKVATATATATATAATKTTTTTEHDNPNLSNTVKKWLSDASTTSSRHETSRIRVTPTYCLRGHLGSVFSVKFGNGGKYIASTSDDRSVRLWALNPTNHSSEAVTIAKDEISSEMILALQSSHAYKLVWTGWGHTARVWDVAFAFPSSNRKCSSSLLLATSGEDSTARVWSPFSSEKEIAHPLRGHRCESVWTVNACEGIIITGGNDGCLKLYDLESRVKSEEESAAAIRTFVVPKDSRLITTTDGTTKSHKKQKRKRNGQVVCGMEFYGSEGMVQSKLLVATRAGGLFSLDLISHDWSDYSTWSESVVSTSDNNVVVQVDPSSGNCLGVHPNGDCAVVGTTEGWLIISSLSESPVKSSKNLAFRSPPHQPAQSVSFLDDTSLIVLYAKGSVVWFKFEECPIPMHVMTLGTTGIPLSIAYNEIDHAMYVGDSRGNIAFFDLSKGTSQGAHEQRPKSLLTKVHSKEHVTGITVKSGVIVSVGNDGCMHQCVRDANDGQLKKLISIPIPNVTGLKQVWNVAPDGKESVILGGFYGNDFVMLDSIHGYEFVRVHTGGRQRRQDVLFSFHNNTPTFRCPSIFGMAILTGQKDGSNAIEFHCSDLFEKSLASLDLPPRHMRKIQCSYSIGSPVHAETINDICWVKGPDESYLLTGSNDCTVKLSKLENKSFVSVMELPPHESCVRGVCSSRHPNSDSSLLVTCGGKLSMEFYALSHRRRPGKNDSPNVSLLCSYRTLETATIDHRMNAVRATPLHPHDKQCHLVLSGDSDGNLHLCTVSTRARYYYSQYQSAVTRRTTIGTILKGNGRPVLCLELLQCNDKILAFVGTTGGDILVWVFPGTINSSDGEFGVHCLEGAVPASPVHIIRAHQTGVNGLSVAIANSHCSIVNGLSVIVCSVGDDQALSTCVLSFDGSLPPKEVHLLITQCASSSALKAVKIVPGYKNDRIYTTGLDAQIQLWQFSVSQNLMLIKHLSTTKLGTDGSCIDCVRLEQREGPVYEAIAIGGEGIDLLVHSI